MSKLQLIALMAVVNRVFCLNYSRGRKKALKQKEGFQI